MTIHSYVAHPAFFGEKLSVTPKQSMKISGLSQRKTYAFIKAGILPAIWNGKGYIIPVASLHEFLKERAKVESHELARKNRVAVRARDPSCGGPPAA